MGVGELIAGDGTRPTQHVVMTYRLASTGGACGPGLAVMTLASGKQMAAAGMGLGRGREADVGV